MGAPKHDSAYLCMDPSSHSRSGGTDSSIDVQLVRLWLSVATSNPAPAHPGGFKKARKLMIFRYFICKCVCSSELLSYFVN